MKNIQEVLQKVTASQELTELFTKDPAAALKSIGQNPGDYTISAPQSKAGVADISFCVSVGCVVCASVG